MANEPRGIPNSAASRLAKPCSLWGSVQTYPLMQGQQVTSSPVKVSSFSTGTFNLQCANTHAFANEFAFTGHPFSKFKQLT